MRVVLVQPPISSIEGWGPPLGLLSLATVLRDAGVACKVYDLSDGVSRIDDVREEISQGDSPLVGITATIANYREALHIAEEAPGWVVFGGPHPTVDPAAFLTNERHLVVRGEGEAALPEIVRALAAGRNPVGFPGVCGSVAGRTIITEPAPPLESFANLPCVDRHFVDMGRYRLRLMGRRATTMLSSRGCPYHCAFCYNGFLGYRYRVRSACAVVEEVQTLRREFGFGGIVFYDDNFTNDRRRVREICDLLRENGLDVVWRCYSRIGSLSKELLEAMRDGGCVSIVFGAESGSDRTLKRVRKGIRIEQTLKTSELCQQAGIHAKFSFIIGFPWEDETDITQTLQMIEKVAPNSASLSLFTPFPGTELFEEITSHGGSIDLSGDITHMSVPTFELDRMSRQDLIGYLEEGRRLIARARAFDLVELSEK